MNENKENPNYPVWFKFNSECSWTLGADSSDFVNYFFNMDHDFGTWSFHPDHTRCIDPIRFLDPKDESLAVTAPDHAHTSTSAAAVAGSSLRGGGGGDVSVSNPSISSNSSEDPAEKFIISGEKFPEKPPPIVCAVIIDYGVFGRKKGQKRIRQPRFGFMTKSDIDHLEDGYRWRKYGQKPVKNSPFPRSYYRCTNSKCTVKKVVERSSQEPTIVVTTYEGQHCHISDGFPRERIISTHETSFARNLTSHMSQLYYPSVELPRQINPPSTTWPHRILAVNEALLNDHQQPRALQDGDSNLQVPPDEGTVGDMVPPGQRNR